LLLGGANGLAVADLMPLISWPRRLPPRGPARWLCEGGVGRTLTIERSFAWLGCNRRLAKDLETLVETSTAMAAIAIVQLLVRRLATV
jgi:predicted RNA polymerase sigma factor